MILNADARAIPLRDGAVQCVVTSPPYWGLRDYGHDAQLGLERTPEEYVAGMVAVFREVRRVLRDDGTCWLNLGDCYATGAGKVGERPGGGAQGDGWALRGAMTSPNRMPLPGLKPKDLVGIPWRVAFALQADGWWLRSDIVWSKPNPMPESITDRPTKAHEYVFLLAKSERYYYDAEAIKEQAIHAGKMVSTNGNDGMDAGYDGHRTRDGLRRGVTVQAARNRRTVWEIATQPYPEAHFATFPEALVEPCVLAGTSERGCCPTCGAGWERHLERERIDTRPDTRLRNVGGRDDGYTRIAAAGGIRPDALTTTGWQPGCQHSRHPVAPGPETVPALVLDPFAGSGTVGQVCQRLGRRFVGLELSPEYCRLAYRRTAQLGLV